MYDLNGKNYIRYQSVNCNCDQLIAVNYRAVNFLQSIVVYSVII